ncbi:transcription factor bHLH147-like [Olea europaea var. sylvestris]|uniref:Transcription factor bHLH149-like n=1 Tax=Olea europaea subsp. europaea TaxID=158383 RepID=A0A8S0RE50_OLEEU|nr:transcription factor bHLH147-like [Olea europaea var. sylvestris]CAA2977841.1 transcription factor bHLH149-like [Olea europaea subsp. europaea]
MASSFTANPDMNLNPLRKKRRKVRRENQSQMNTTEKMGRARRGTETEQMIYSSKLVGALRHLRRPESSSPSASGRAVREAADRILAVSAKVKTRWSRAILTGRLSLRLSQINKKRKKASKPTTVDSRLKKRTVKKKLPPAHSKVRVLGGLVPGCRKLSFPNLLEETADYIAALQMQVNAMTFLTGLLTNGSSLAASSDQLGSDQ